MSTRAEPAQFEYGEAYQRGQAQKYRDRANNHWKYRIELAHRLVEDHCLPRLSGTPREQTVLVDIGCSIGTFAIEFAKKGFRTFGVDFDETALRIARELAHEEGVTPEFVHGDVADWRLRFPPIDIAICFDLFEHLHDDILGSFLHAVHGQLSERGSLVFHTFPTQYHYIFYKRYRRWPLLPFRGLSPRRFNSLVKAYASVIDLGMLLTAGQTYRDSISTTCHCNPTTRERLADILDRAGYEVAFAEAAHLFPFTDAQRSKRASARQFARQPIAQRNLYGVAVPKPTEPAAMSDDRQRIPERAHSPAVGEAAGLEHASCDLCGADDARLLFTRADERLHVDDVRYGVVVCRQCGLGYLNPRPTPAALRRYYPEEFFARRGQPGSDGWRYELQAGFVERFAPGRLLDIGCAAGAFLQLMRQKGWHTVGVDISDKAGNPYGLDLRHGEFLEMDFAPGSFDLITSWATFEHLYHPKAYFRQAAELLAPGGSLVVQVPNFRWPGFCFGRKEDVPRHLHFFTARTLSLMASSVGLDPQRIVGDFSMNTIKHSGWIRVPIYAKLGLTYRDYHADRRKSIRQRFPERPVLTLLCALLSPVETCLANRLFLAITGRAPILVGYFGKS